MKNYIFSDGILVGPFEIEKDKNEHGNYHSRTKTIIRLNAFLSAW